MIMSEPSTGGPSAATHERTVLHVGCGPNRPHNLHARFRIPGWREVRLDIDPQVVPDIVSSITSMPMVGTASIDAVWSSHNLEHLYAHEVPLALAEFLRVLRPKGFIFLTLPDLQAVAQLVADDKLEDTAYVSPIGPIAPLDMIYGHRRSIAGGNVFMAHHTGFTARTLGNTLIAAGFAKAQVWREGFALWAEATKGPVDKVSR
jgi:predicted SAM-dependent methyltransferase